MWFILHKALSSAKNALLDLIFLTATLWKQVKAVEFTHQTASETDEAQKNGSK